MIAHKDYVLKPHGVDYYSQRIQELEASATPSPLPSWLHDQG